MQDAPTTAAVTDFGQFARLRSAARAENPQALREAARQFESLFVQQLLKASRSDDASNDLLGGSQGDVYRDLYDQQMALHLASGRGLGIAELMVRQLQQQGLGGSAAQADSMTAPISRPVQAPVPVASHAIKPQDSNGPGNFVQSLLPHARQAARQLGIPAEVLIAQAALETGWGEHPITDSAGRSSHNYFGIKANAGWKGARVEVSTHEVRNGVVSAEQAEFRSYGSAAEGFQDYVRFVRENPRYAEALRHGGSGSRYAEGLQKAGYATDPYYASKIDRIANGRVLRAAAAI